MRSPVVRVHNVHQAQTIVEIFKVRYKAIYGTSHLFYFRIVDSMSEFVVTLISIGLFQGTLASWS